MYRCIFCVKISRKNLKGINGKNRKWSDYGLNVAFQVMVWVGQKYWAGMYVWWSNLYFNKIILKKLILDSKMYLWIRDWDWRVRTGSWRTFHPLIRFSLRYTCIRTRTRTKDIWLIVYALWVCLSIPRQVEWASDIEVQLEREARGSWRVRPLISLLFLDAFLQLQLQLQTHVRSSSCFSALLYLLTYFSYLYWIELKQACHYFSSLAYLLPV